MRLWFAVVALAGCGRIGFDDTADGAPATLPCGIPGTALGGQCPDGTVYAGVSPDGDAPLYVRRCDLGQMFDGTACVGTRMTACFNNCNPNGRTTTNTVDFDHGAANTLALLTIDSDDSVPGVQPHIAAMLCATLVAEGHSDWYLPAKNELDAMYANRDAIGGFYTSIQARMFSSTEAIDGRFARFRNWYDPTEDYDINKFYDLEFVRCVRK